VWELTEVLSGDLSERPGYDLSQIRSIAKVQVRSSSPN